MSDEPEVLSRAVWLRSPFRLALAEPVRLTFNWRTSPPACTVPEPEMSTFSSSPRTRPSATLLEPLASSFTLSASSDCALMRLEPAQQRSSRTTEPASCTPREPLLRSVKSPPFKPFTVTWPEPEA